MNFDVAIIDSGGANFASIQAALSRLTVNSVVTSDPGTIMRAERVILPGVGSAAYAMDLIRRSGLYDVIRSLKQPVLKICMGSRYCVLRLKKREVLNVLALFLFE